MLTPATDRSHPHAAEPLPRFAPFESKLRVPSVREGTIERAPLAHRFRLALGARIVTVSAPAGFGKTTLLARWAARDARPFAWLTLDETDRDPRVFLAYVALALDRVVPLEPLVFRTLGRPRVPVSEIVARIGGALADVERPFVLVLDNADLLGKRSIAALDALEEALPPCAQLVVSGRTDAEMLSKSRASNRLVKFGAEELRLSDREAATLLAAAGLAVDDATAVQLNAHAEGWAAGLYLAALALRPGPGARAALPSDFSGAHRFVSDYFRLELLSRLPDEEVEFLTRVSVLDRMNGPLCDAVVGRARSAATLASLERANLFVEALDGAPRRFRLRTLFREMLREELERREPGIAAELNRRAADWCEANGDLADAIDYADAAGDRRRVVSLLGRAALPAYFAGRLPEIEHWLERLDDWELLEHEPGIALLGAVMLALRGRVDAAERWASVAERRPGERARGRRELVPLIPLFRAVLCRDGVEQLRRDARLARRRVPADDIWHSAATLMLGVAALLVGDADAADAHFAEAIAEAERTGAIGTCAAALAERSLIAGADGDSEAAEAFAVRARELLQEAGIADHATSALTYAASVRSALRRNDWVRAEEDLGNAASILPDLTHALPWMAVQARLELAECHRLLAEPEAARRLAHEAESILARRPGLGILADETVALRSRLHPQGGRAPGDAWASSLTRAELKLLPMLTTHLSFREIADCLGLSRNTVKTQAISVYRKLGVSSRSAAIERAAALGLDGETAESEKAVRHARTR
jgi:LuxR family maltose regulon positive regulatory protein